MDDDSPSEDPRDSEEKFLKMLVEAFKMMNLNIDSDQLRNMIHQFRNQLEGLGINPEDLSEGKIDLNLNANLGDIAKIFGGENNPLSDMFTGENNPLDIFAMANMGKGGEKEGITHIPIPKSPGKSISHAPNRSEADIIEDDDMMTVTVDCGQFDDLTSDEIETILTDNGMVLQILRDTQPEPLNRITLPKRAAEVVSWTFTNGILDLQLSYYEGPENKGSISIE